MDGNDITAKWLDQKLDAARRCYEFESAVFYTRWAAVEGIIGYDNLTERQVSAIERASSSATWAVEELVGIRKVIEDYFELLVLLPNEMIKELEGYQRVLDAESRDIRDKQDVLRNARTNLVRKGQDYVRVNDR
jgi:hypothetical protein